MQIRPGEQIAKVASELFPDAATDGWIGVSTDAEEMDAFWLTYDAEMTYLDGGEAAQVETTGADQVIPLVAGDTELTVLCLSGLQSAVPVTIRLFGSDGSELAPAFTEGLPSIGALRAKVSLMFPSADMTEARYMRITSSRSVASSALIKHFLVPFEAAVVNGVNVGTSMHMNFPHIVNGKVPGANYTTTIGVTNLSNSPQTISITFNPDAGIPIVATRDLTGNGALRETVQSLFGLTSEFQTGWVGVAGTAPITGFAAYADDIGGGLAAVPATASQMNLFACRRVAVARPCVQHQIGQREPSKMRGLRQSWSKDQPSWIDTSNQRFSWKIIRYPSIGREQPKHAAGHRLQEVHPDTEHVRSDLMGFVE